MKMWENVSGWFSGVLTGCLYYWMSGGGVFLIVITTPALDRTQPPIE
jgi:hypothetical protein